MTFTQWLFGGFENPVTNGRWGFWHILTLVICAACIVGFYFLAKHAANRDKTRRVIICTLAGLIAFFEIMIRFVYAMKLYYFQHPDMNGTNALWILLPKPWCAISCWLLVACVFTKKPFLYNFASISALLCSLIFFAYPGVGYNNQYIIFDNLYSIVTHALLLTMSISLMTLKFTDFKYKHIWKIAVGLALTVIYSLIQVFFLKTYPDPMYFMPDGDIQADILGIGYGLYLFLYILLLVVYVNVFHLIGDWATVKAFFGKAKQKIGAGK